ncbi:MAG: segregation/condensation protein A, partial [Candidatus Auribacterota bacterium]|nr:segregation/condensation protein A [Candidatus Auribacterota bacterium]
HITKILENKKSVKFSDLFDPGSHKGEIVVTFLALLELIRLKTIKAIQKKAFCDIFIELVKTV